MIKRKLRSIVICLLILAVSLLIAFSLIKAIEADIDEKAQVLARIDTLVVSMMEECLDDAAKILIGPHGLGNNRLRSQRDRQLAIALELFEGRIRLAASLNQ